MTDGERDGAGGSRPSGPALVAGPPRRIGEDSEAAAVMAHRLRTQVATLLSLDTAVRAERPDAVHQMRVTVRRLRSLLSTFRSCFTPERRRELRSELRWLGTALGELRDAEVLSALFDERLDGLPADQVLGPVRRELALRMRRDRRQARAALDGVLASDRYRRLIDRLVDFADRPPTTAAASLPAAVALPPVVRREHRRLRRLMRRARPATGPRRDVLLHEVRKQAKVVRYAAETLEPAWGASARRQVELLKSVQDELGARQDEVVARRILRAEGAVAGVAAGHNGYTYGVLVGLSLGTGARAERRFLAMWRKLDRRSVRRWPAAATGHPK